MVDPFSNGPCDLHPVSGRDPGSLLIVRTAFVATYPPRRCGIATFTHDLAAASSHREVVALHPPEQASAAYPVEVHHRIRKDRAGRLRARSPRPSRDCVDVVSIQHEYGIWGGEDGEHVLDFARALDVPAVTTLHTVMRHPTPRQRAILTELVGLTDATVVMSRSAADLLSSAYGVEPSRVARHPARRSGPAARRRRHRQAAPRRRGPQGHPQLRPARPGQGLRARDRRPCPSVVAAHPIVLYVIVGATHPDLLRARGRGVSRIGLVAAVAALGLEDHVRFVDRFVGRVELTRWLEAADVFVTPYPNLDQIVSGTLSYAMGAGRAVVSTPYAYASELLADGRGVLVPPASPAALAAGP